jgi:hypothetical protein
MVIKFKSNAQSVHNGTGISVPNAQVKPPIGEVPPFETLKKKRIYKPVRAIQPTPEQLEGDAIWRTGQLLWVLGIGQPALWKRIKLRLIPVPLRDKRPYWPADVIREYLKSPEEYARKALEKQLAQHPDFQRHRRASMRATLANMKRARTIKAEDARLRESQAKADARYRARNC